MAAEVKILITGYTNADRKTENEQEETCPTITLVKDKNLVMVVDPGILDSQEVLVAALNREGLKIADVNMVCITHSHLDHYRNIGMFAEAKALDFFGVWEENSVKEWSEHFTENIQIMKTPGHNSDSITLFVKTDEGTVAICGDVFWREDGPRIDPLAADADALKYSRSLVLKTADWIIPGHSSIYKNSDKRSSFDQKQAKPTAKSLGFCRSCKRKFNRQKDKCLCQEWLCYHCCECDLDCLQCNCKHRI